MTAIVKSTGKLPDIKKARALTIISITQKIRSGAVSNSPYKSGTLRRSIISDVKPDLGVGKVGTNLPYAKIREFGGTIYPKKRKALMFMKGGKPIFAKKVVQKGKPYLIPAYNLEIRKISSSFKRNLELTTK